MKGKYQDLLADYQSMYTGEQIDDRLTKAGTAVQGVTIDGVPQPKDDNNVVNLPAVATPADVDAKVAEEKQRAEGAEAALAAAVQEEKTRAEGVESRLQGNIDAEVQRATSQEASLQQSISGETQRAIGKETELQNGINTETQRATAKENELQGKIDTKQPIIADLDAIRSGAAKGATAVQPAAIADMETKTHASSTYATKTEVATGLASKQNVIADLAAIRSGAAAGATAVQPSALAAYMTAEQIAALYATKAELDAKIQRVELWYNYRSNTICLLGQTIALTYEQVADYVNDKSKFVTLLDIDGEYLLPQMNDGGALIFTGLNVLSYGTWAHRIAINIDNDVKAEYYELAQKSDLDAKQDKLTAGDNITIKDNVISAEGGIGVAEGNALAEQMTLAPSVQSFVKRTSPAVANGVFKVKGIRGNSLVWNQLADTLTSSKWTNRQGNVTYLDNGAVYNGVGGIGYAENYPIENPIHFKVGHKYLGTIVVTEVDNGEIQFGESDASHFPKVNTIGFHYGFLTATTNDVLRYVAAGTSISFKDMLLYDLTQMFDAGNEPATYEEFLQRKSFVEDEFAYDEGTIINNKVEGIKTTGINIYDEEWEHGLWADGAKIDNAHYLRAKNLINILPNTTYHLHSDSAYDATQFCFLVNEFDAKGVFIKTIPLIGRDVAYTSSGNCYYIGISWGDWSDQGLPTTYNHDICINISNPTIDGQYFPYEEHSLDLSWIKDIKDENGVTLFPNGLCSVDEIYDEANKGRAIKRIGQDAEGNNYVLTSPIVVRYPEKVMIAPAFVGSMESIVAEGDSAPAVLEMGYPLNIRSLF